MKKFFLDAQYLSSFDAIFYLKHACGILTAKKCFFQNKLIKPNLNLRITFKIIKFIWVDVEILY